MLKRNCRLITVVALVFGSVSCFNGWTKNNVTVDSDRPTTAGAQSDKADLWLHPTAKMQFPKHVGAYVRLQPESYNEAKSDWGVGYFSYKPHVSASVFVYPSPMGNRTKILNTHFEKTKEDVVKNHKKPKLETEGDFQLTMNGKLEVGKKAQYTCDHPYGPVVLRARTDLYLFIHNNYFIKYRFTYPIEGPNQGAFESTTQFMMDLRWFR